MRRRTIGLILILVVTLIFVLAGWREWKHRQIFPGTDNAYVGGEVSTVSSRIPGTLEEVLIVENEQVVEGQVLFRVDPRDYDQAVAENEARYAMARAAIALDEARIEGAKAEVTAAASEAELAAADEERFAELSRRGSVPEHRYLEVKTKAEIARARLSAAQKNLDAARAALDVAHKDLERAWTGLEQARLRRSYCTITAPCSGMVADKAAQVQQVVAAGQPLCKVVPLDGENLWIDANFKETQLRRIRPGQPVDIRIDSNKNLHLQGTVEALGAGTGAAFSLLPPENASGNWVKVVQRLPVRIRFDSKGLR